MNDRLGPYQMGPSDTEENGIFVGDAAVLAAEIPENSVDLIYTDPPYPREFTHVWYDMGRYATRVLKPGGSLITLCGNSKVSMAVDALSGLDFRWMGWMMHGQKQSVMGYKVICGGKPLLWFTKGPVKSFYGFWWDSKPPTGRDKRFHEWGQEITHAYNDILLLTLPGDIVLDPFCGGGTTAAACIATGRRYLSFEIDPSVAAVARRRLESVQVMLPLEEVSTQTELFNSPEGVL